MARRKRIGAMLRKGDLSGWGGHGADTQDGCTCTAREGDDLKCRIHYAPQPKPKKGPRR